MRFEWDSDKAKSNFDKHGISFDEAKTVFDDRLYAVFADPDHSSQEERFIILGESHQGQLLVVAYTERALGTRLISARRATRRERKNYEADL